MGAAWGRGGAVGGAILLLLSGCAIDATGPGSGNIAGLYLLAEVDGRPPPCCAEPDSSGGSVTIVGGTLFLGEARSEAYVYTPAGIALARSCVHEIPNGALVDTANVVHLPDGTSYKLPRCGDGPYRLVVTRRHAFADGTARTVADTSSGLYTWSGAGGTGTATLITLVDVGMGGTVTIFNPGATIRIARQHVGPPDLWPHEHEYLFGSAAD